MGVIPPKFREFNAFAKATAISGWNNGTAFRPSLKFPRGTPTAHVALLAAEGEGAKNGAIRIAGEDGDVPTVCGLRSATTIPVAMNVGGGAQQYSLKSLQGEEEVMTGFGEPPFTVVLQFGSPYRRRT